MGGLSLYCVSESYEAFSEGIICYKVCQVKERNFTVTVN